MAVSLHFAFLFQYYLVVFSTGLSQKIVQARPQAL